MMRLLHSLLLPVAIFLILIAAQSTTGAEVNGYNIQYNKTELGDVEKGEMLETEGKAGNVVVGNFMADEQKPSTSSPMSPIYERIEFMVLSAGIVLYLALMVSTGTVVIMCCMCAKSRVKEDEDSQKKKVDDKTEE
ncbi:unnamed protein product [Litomosoides sigmodontis]|uniref:Transmembrane protein n=1 Tax=Litomosoides sigmodontis TaxID=42156 RepID=A0A3P6T6E6_LITSI|nr:unnamed protein product [Litomosoides sigmodontis]